MASHVKLEEIWDPLLISGKKMYLSTNDNRVKETFELKVKYARDVDIAKYACMYTDSSWRTTTLLRQNLKT